MDPTQQQQQQPQPQYTTVGSIYNPQAQPLQPPTRRGRTVKSLFPYRNESTLPSAPQEYSPLQQNFDRAVSPTNPTSPTGLVEYTPPFNTHQDSHSLNALGMPNPTMQPGLSPATNPAATPDKHAHTNIRNDDHDDLEDDATLRQMTHMNFKTLTNLASYPNPMQKAAQKVLSSHRPVAVTPHARDHSAQPALYPQESDRMKEQRAPIDNLRSARSDPASMASLLQSDSVNEYAGFDRYAQSRFPLGLATSNTAHRDSTYGAILSKGPGAPAPLTAGPPGQRQYRPSTFDSTLSNLQSNLQKSREHEEDVALPNPYHTHILQRSSYPPVNRESSPSFESEGVTSIEAALKTDKGDSDKKIQTVDTLSSDDVRAFYPSGLPTDFNYDTERISDDWIFDYPSGERCWDQYREEFWEARQAKVKKDFYSGGDMLNKSFASAVSERNRRNVAYAIGSVYEEARKSQGKVINRKLTIEDASAIPTHEHAAPLLSMVFQTLANRPEVNPYSKLPKFDHLR